MNSTIEKIIESIVITQNPDGSPHIAPFGLRQRNNLVLIAPFRPSTSLDNNISPFMGFNRAQAAVLELCVLVSRLNRLPIDKIDAEINYLQIAVDKTAGEHEIEAWQWLIDAVENHKSALQGNNIA